MMEPLTETQMTWVDNRVQVAADKAAREAAARTRRQALIGFLVLLVAIGFVQWDSSRAANDARQAVVQSGTVIAVDACNRDYKGRVEIRAVLEASKDFQAAALKRGDITQAGYERATDFYEERLDNLPLPDCRQAEGVLTADPDEVPAIPKALHP